MKNIAEECQSLQTASPCYSIAKPTLQIPLNFNRVEKPNIKVSILLIFLLPLSFYFSVMHNSKTIQYQTIALLMEIILTCLGLRVSYDWQVMASKPFPRSFAFTLGHLFGFSPINCVSVASVIRPHPDYRTSPLQAATSSLLRTNSV